MNGLRLACELLFVAFLALALPACSCNGGTEEVATIDGTSQKTDSKMNAGEAANPKSSDVEGGKSDASDSEEKEEDPAKLFIIERSKNENIVRYDAQFTDEGKLDPEEPVVAYWILHAEEGQREELSWTQRKMAYGFKTKPAPSGEGYIMKMKPLPKRELRIKMVDGAARAQLDIDGKPAELEKIYVDSDQGWTGPDVNYVNLFGKDLETGEERTEKIVPE